VPAAIGDLAAAVLGCLETHYTRTQPLQQILPPRNSQSSFNVSPHLYSVPIIETFLDFPDADLVALHVSSLPDFTPLSLCEFELLGAAQNVGDGMCPIGQQWKSAAR
jgi:hypothetical protein